MFTLKELVNIIGGAPVSVKADLSVSGISTDSRTIRKGELFVCLSGEHFDGCNFINAARKRGAVAAVVPEGVKNIAGLPLIRVKDTKEALGSIAKAHRDRFNIPIIAITGSNGKTVTKEMIAQILNERYKVLKTDKNENNKIGVAHTLLKLKDQDVAVIEVGTNSPGEIKYHSAILRPDLAIITNIGLSHLQGLIDTKGVLKEKFALVKSLGPNGVWIKNADDQMLSRAEPPWPAKTSATLPEVVTYGMKKKKLNFRATNIKQTNSGIEFRLIKFKLGTVLKHELLCLRTVPDGLHFSLPLFGVHNVYNALAAITCCSAFVEIETIRRVLANFKGLDMRMEVLNTDSFNIINDTYNSNPLSFRCALSALKDYPVSGRRIVVCADMLELGKNSERLHYQSGQLLAREGIDRLITFGQRADSIAKGAIDEGMNENRVTIFRDKNKIISFLRSIIAKGDTILVKGSRGMKMEEVTNGIINSCKL